MDLRFAALQLIIMGMGYFVTFGAGKKRSMERGYGELALSISTL
jgi:hypothetical protein